jgi:hypothetical protein
VSNSGDSAGTIPSLLVVKPDFGTIHLGNIEPGTNAGT